MTGYVWIVQEIASRGIVGVYESAAAACQAYPNLETTHYDRLGDAELQDDRHVCERHAVWQYERS